MIEINQKQSHQEESFNPVRPRTESLDVKQSKFNQKYIFVVLSIIFVLGLIFLAILLLLKINLFSNPDNQETIQSTVFENEKTINIEPTTTDLNSISDLELNSLSENPTVSVTDTMQVTVKPTEDPTREWLSSFFPDYSLKFKHPDSWIFTKKDIKAESQAEYVIKSSLMTNDIDGFIVKIDIWENKNQLNLTNWLEIMQDNKALPLPVEDLSLTANGNITKMQIPILRFWHDPLSRGEKPGNCGQACPIQDVYFTKGEYAYRIELNYTREVDQASQDLFNQFIDNIEFI